MQKNIQLASDVFVYALARFHNIKYIYTIQNNLNLKQFCVTLPSQSKKKTGSPHRLSQNIFLLFLHEILTP